MKCHTNKVEETNPGV